MLENSNVFSSDKSPAFGIDLGTTNSCISVLRKGNLSEIIPMRDGSATLPSCVMFKGKNTKAIVGKEAYKKRHKPNVSYSVKRFMGTDEDVKFEYHGEEWTMKPYEVSAEILKELVYQISDRYKDVRDVVITVPADFNNRQIEDTLKSAKLANLNVLQILREPTAAAIVLGLEDKVQGDVLVYDLGGGTFDASLLTISSQAGDSSDIDDLYGFDSDDSSTSNEANRTYVVKATRGNSHLGGDDLDRALLKIALDKIQSKGFDVSLMPEDYKEALLLRLEGMKKMSVKNTFEMPITYTVRGKSGQRKVDTMIIIGPNEFFEATRVIFEESKKLVDSLLATYSGKIVGFITVGGSTKNPYIKDLIEHTYKVKVHDELNPDESVSMGAAIQARNLKFKDSGVSVLDVISNGIGIYASNSITNVIPRDQTVPCSISSLFSTVKDNQEEIFVHVYSGNSSIPEDCDYLGTIKLDNIVKGPAGTIGVSVKLSIDSNGLLECYAKVGDTFVSKVLTNVLGKSSSKSTLVEKKISRWTAYANNLQDKAVAAKLIAQITEFELGAENEEIIIELIRNSRTKSLDKFKSAGHDYRKAVTLENVVE